VGPAQHAMPTLPQPQALPAGAAVVLSYSQATGTQLAQRRLCGSALKSARLCGALSRAVTAVTGDGQYSLVASRIRSYALTGFHTVDHSIRSFVRYFVLLGATSAMGPLDILLAHGTTCGSAHAHTTLGRHAPCCAGSRELSCIGTLVKQAPTSSRSTSTDRTCGKDCSRKCAGRAAR
jgi:hypothetical protein